MVLEVNCSLTDQGLYCESSVSVIEMDGTVTAQAARYFQLAAPGYHHGSYCHETGGHWEQCLFI